MVASVAAGRQKERALEAMESLGLSREVINPILRNLLKTYGNEWDFIEAENYRLLADTYFEQVEAQSSSRGPVTRGRRASSGSDESDDNLYFPDGGRENSTGGGRERAKPPPDTPTSTRPATRGGGRARLETLPSAAKRPNSPFPADVLPAHVAEALDYHSGASVRSRSQNCIPGIRIRGADCNSSAGAINEREKGKSPLVSAGSNCSRLSEPPGRPPPPSGVVKGPAKLVTVKIEVNSEGMGNVAFGPAAEGLKKVGLVPAPEGMEKVAFEKVNGVIIPAVRKNQPEQLPPLSSRVKIEGIPENQAICPAPLQAVDPGTILTIHVKPEPQEAFAMPHELSCDKGKEWVQSGQGAEHELALEVTAQASPGHLQIVPNGTFNQVKGHLSADKKSSTSADPCTVKLEEDGGNGLIPLVDYDSEGEPTEPVPQTTLGAVCDLALMPDELPLEQLDQPEFNGEEIRPNFILTGSLKGDAAEADIMNGEMGCAISKIPLAGHASSGVKRKLILSENTEKSASASTYNGNGTHPMLRSSDNTQEGIANVALKRVKREPGLEVRREPGLENLNSQQLKHNPADISRGTERLPIPFVNEFTSETISDNFNYIPTNIVYQNAYINISLARIGDLDFCLDCAGDCLQAPHSCPCTRETGGVFAYTKDGLLKSQYIEHELTVNHDPESKANRLTYCPNECPIEAENGKCQGHVVRKFVKECWYKCGCSMHCGNRVVQRGISRRLQVFFTDDGRGWGIRTAEDLPAGAFVCEYVGEIMTNSELDQRNQDNCHKTGDQKDTYPVLLDGDWCSEKGLRDEEALCLDATKHGNVARFINHRCYDSNLIDVPVSIEGMDRHYYHVAFFTKRNVRAWEELTWDYKIDFEDENHPIKAFQCLCKSDVCRGGHAGAGAGAVSSTKKRKK